MRIREMFWAAFWLALAGLMVIYSKSNAADRRHAALPAGIAVQGETPFAAHIAHFLLGTIEKSLSPDHLATRSVTSLRLAYEAAHQKILREELASNETRYRIAAPAAPAESPRSAPVSDRDMTFLVVKDERPDCAPRCGRWLAGVGQITENSYARLEAALNATAQEPLPLILDSPGGQINAAISMGMLLRERHIAVSVAKTLVSGCDASKSDCQVTASAGGVHGRLVAEGGRCLSACPFVFMGGTTRVIEGPAVLGIHRVTMLKQQGSEMAQGFAESTAIASTATPDGLPKPVRVRILRYLTSMGIDQEIFDLMMHTPADKMDILSPLELDVYRLITGNGSAATLVAKNAV